MSNRELFDLWNAASPESRDAVMTVLRMTESGHTMEEAADAIKDDRLREYAKQFLTQKS